jgi:hypothetical protein
MNYNSMQLPRSATSLVTRGVSVLLAPARPVFSRALPPGACTSLLYVLPSLLFYPLDHTERWRSGALLFYFFMQSSCLFDRGLDLACSRCCKSREQQGCSKENQFVLVHGLAPFFSLAGESYKLAFQQQFSRNC